MPAEAGKTQTTTNPKTNTTTSIQYGTSPPPQQDRPRVRALTQKEGDTPHPSGIVKYNPWRSLPRRSGRTANPIWSFNA